MPYSGPASAYGVIGKTEEAYFKKVNAEGGINGRKINFISYDDAYSRRRRWNRRASWSRAMKSCSSSTRSARRSNTCDPEVPELEEGAATVRRRPAPPSGTIRRIFPGRWAGSPTTRAKRRSMRSTFSRTSRTPRSPCSIQNDDYGKDYLKGFKDGLGAKGASMIVIEESYEVSEPTIDSHIVKMKSTGADVFINITTPKFAAQAIKKNAEIGWKPLHFLNNVSASIGSVHETRRLRSRQGHHLVQPTSRRPIPQ
jgi:branched-chain amino acid transport system substrate-binding protein